ncbi:MAG: hypothetical protein LUI06_06535 [Ruminococcus sp.]|nr:hypothetical protein [Ruminococcus sp.]
MSFRRINLAALAQMRNHKKLFTATIILIAIIALFSALYTTSMFPIAAIGSLVVSNIFKDMLNKNVCDIEHSLPLSANERYFSKLLAILYMHILPVTVLSFLIFLLFNNEGILDPDEYLTIICIALLQCLFVDAIAVFSCCHIGCFAESIYLSWILVFIISFLPYILVFKVCYMTAGLSSLSSDVFECWGLTITNQSAGDVSFFIKVCINCLISLALMVLSIFFYKTRDGKTVGKPIANKLYFEILMLLLVLTVFCIATFSEAIGLWFFIMAAIYVIINLIVMRKELKLKNFAVWLLKYVGSIAVCVIITAICFFTECFGASRKVPKADLSDCNVSIIICDSSSYVYSALDLPDVPDYTSIYNQSAKLTDEQTRSIIKTVQSITTNRNHTIGDFIVALKNGKPNDDTVKVTLSVSKEVSKYEYFKNYSDYEKHLYETDVDDMYSVSLLDQSICVTEEEAYELYDMLSSLDTLSEYQTYSNKYY